MTIGRLKYSMNFRKESYPAHIRRSPSEIGGHVLGNLLTGHWIQENDLQLTNGYFVRHRETPVGRAYIRGAQGHSSTRPKGRCPEDLNGAAKTQS